MGVRKNADSAISEARQLIARINRILDAVAVSDIDEMMRASERSERALAEGLTAQNCAVGPATSKWKFWKHS